MDTVLGTFDFVTANLGTIVTLAFAGIGVLSQPIFATDWGSPREFDDSGREFPRKCAVPVADTDCSAIKYI